jgi:hypothetical protein
MSGSWKNTPKKKIIESLIVVYVINSLALFPPLLDDLIWKISPFLFFQFEIVFVFAFKKSRARPKGRNDNGTRITRRKKKRQS